MRRAPEPPPRPSKITIPDHCHPMAKVVFALMKNQGVTYDELEHRSGVLRSTFKAWRTNNRPGLDTIEAALGSLGYAVLPVPRASVLPDPIREKVESLAEEWGEIDPLLTSLLATVCRTAVVTSQVGPVAVVATIVQRRRKSREPNPLQTDFLAEIAA